jgi:electron transport complex protein RnfC
MKVRIGKRIGEIFSECGGFKTYPKRVAAGSPLLGKPFADLDEPVTKTINSIFAILEGFRQESKGICIGCGECRDVCPVGLDPEELYKKATVSRRGMLVDSPGRAAECQCCGCCEVVCPSMLPLSTGISTFMNWGT